MGGMAQLELDEVHANAVDYQHFLLDSPSPYHAAEVVAQRLVDAGFTRVDEKGAWDASPGGHVMVRGGAVAAWFVPETVDDAGRLGPDRRRGVRRHDVELVAGS